MFDRKTDAKAWIQKVEADSAAEGITFMQKVKNIPLKNP